MYGYLHLDSLPRRARRIVVLHTIHVQTSLAWPCRRWIFALSLRVFAVCVLLCLAIESPPPPRRSSRAAAAALPKSISKPYPSQAADQESPSDDTTAATDGDGKTRAAVERHLRRRIDPAEYWPCDPRPSTQSAACQPYLHRVGGVCESVRQTPAYREHLLFFLLIPSALLSCEQANAMP